MSDRGANFVYHAAGLMTQDHGAGEDVGTNSSSLPVMHIRAADTGLGDVNRHILRFANGWLRIALDCYVFDRS